MKRKDNIRKDSERSDETCSSQDTTSTNVSDNNCSIQTFDKVSSVAKNEDSLGHGAVTFDLVGVDETDTTSSVANATKWNEKTNNDSLSVPKDNVVNKATVKDKNYNQNIQNKEGDILSGGQQLNKPRSQLYKCNTNCFSVEDEPLLKGESAKSIISMHSANELRETSEYPIQISHANAYPRNITRDGYNYSSCVCGRCLCGPKSFSNDAEANVKTITENYNGLKTSYRRIWGIFVALAVLDLIMVICVITVMPSVAITRPPGPPPWTTTAPLADDLDVYNICFDCADLEKDRDFSAETLRGVYRRDGSCCFKSITSVYWSLKQNQIEDRIKSLNYSMAYLQTLSVNEETVKRNFTTDYIGRLLMLNSPKEKTAVHLVSTEGPPEQDDTMSGVFHKLRWNQGGDKTVLRGKAYIWNGLNLKIQSEGYYFLYARLHFKTKPGYRDVTVTYSINRQRGSTSTYIHEAKESCRTAGSSLEHSGVVELVVHLARFDEIFISVSKSDVEYLATEAGAHMLGLFEL